MKLNHMHIAVPDVAKARQFFGDFFDMTLAFEHGDGVFLKDEVGFLLAIDPLEEGERVEFPKWFHYGFCLESKERVKSVYDKMLANGVEMARPYQEWGDKAANFFCWSPGPFLMEVSWNEGEA